MEGWILLVILVVGLLALALAFRLIIWGIAGAALLFAWASEQGFLGAAAYIACFVFFFPVMAVISIVVGIFNALEDKAEEAVFEGMIKRAKQVGELQRAESERSAAPVSDKENN